MNSPSLFCFICDKEIKSHEIIDSICKECDQLICDNCYDGHYTREVIGVYE